jgi:hypothetical protein
VPLEPGDPAPDREGPWRVAGTGRRVLWRGDRADCEVCRDPVALDERHHYARLTTAPGGRPRANTETEVVVFCTRACFERWGEG